MSLPQRGTNVVGMRGLLVVNPAATTTTERVRNVLVSALSADLVLETVLTKGRGHAAELARGAAESGVDLVICLGGDGTVNEVTNGLLAAGPSPATPALAVVPGGSTNVFARALGFSPSPVEATGELLDHLREGRSRRISLGHARYGPQTRWFVFCAGMGLDAEVVAQVERKRAKGRSNTPGLFLRSALARYARGIGHDRPQITLGMEPDPEPAEAAHAAAEQETGQDATARDEQAAARRTVEIAIVCNTLPWTYLGTRPVRACPEASFTTGLDVLGVRRQRLGTMLRTAGQMLAGERGPHGRNITLAHDLSRLRLAASAPAPFQVDGEYLGEYDEVELTAHPNALRVIAAPPPAPPRDEP